jgi:hypothetical protein
MGEKKMAVAYARYMLCYIFYLVAIILGLTEYVFVYKIVWILLLMDVGTGSNFTAVRG